MEPGLRFADLLRQLRTEARLTQEELAEQAELSPRSVSDLERGINRTARKDSALMLASALKLTGPVQEAFVAAARGRAEPARVLAVIAGQEAGWRLGGHLRDRRDGWHWQDDVRRARSAPARRALP